MKNKKNPGADRDFSLNQFLIQGAKYVSPRHMQLLLLP